MAQLGHGTTQVAKLDVSALSHTFTSISGSLTQACSSDFSDLSDRRKNEVRSLTFAPPPSKAKAFITPTAKRGVVHCLCIRRAFKWDRHAQDIREEHNSKVRICRSENPYNKGSMRFIFEMLEMKEDADGYYLPEETRRMVAKESLHESTSESNELSFVKNSCLARHYAKKFRKQTAVKIDVLRCNVYEVVKTDSWATLTHFCGEEFISGTFFKWLSNNGWVSDSEAAEGGSCFAHFTLEASRGKHIVTDIQGVISKRGTSDQSIHLTDPQVLSLDRAFGQADLGCSGMQKFVATHRCGRMCKHFGLKPCTLSPIAYLASQPVHLHQGSTFSKVFLHCYSRCPSAFHAVLDDGPELQPARAALTAAQMSWRVLGGAKVFVGPDKYHAVVSIVNRQKLRAHHVILEETFEPLLQAALSRLPSRCRVDQLSKEPIAFLGDEGEVVSKDRTFLDIPRELRNPNSVTQSTGEAHGRKNHRRFVVDETPTPHREHPLEQEYHETWTYRPPLRTREEPQSQGSSLSPCSPHPRARPHGSSDRAVDHGSAPCMIL